jgi:hypothetical protein
VNLHRPPGRASIIAIVLLAVGFVTTSAVAVWQYAELRRAEGRIEELEAGEDGGGFLGDLGDTLEEAFGDAFAEGLGSLGGESGDLAACLLPDEPFSAAPVGDVPLPEQIAAIAEAVEELRGLEFTDAVEPELVSPQEIASRVRELFLAEYTAAMGDAESRILTALGAIPAGTDLRSLRADLLGSQVAGFYDPQTGELVVRQAGDELSVNDRIVLAHELDHALTDQALDLPLPDDLRPGREDGDLAATALVEGDATLLMQRYAATLSFEDQLGALDPTALLDAIQAETDLGELPPYLQAELRFPYEAGLSFVCERYSAGGWEAVDGAYHDPPESSLEILVPEPAPPPPVAVNAAGLLLEPWERVTASQLGAAQLLWLLEAPGGNPAEGLDNARTVVEEWMGGGLELWRRGPDSAVGVAIADRPGAPSLCEAVAEWYRRSFHDDEHPSVPGYEVVADGPRQDAVLTCGGGEVRLGIAPDLRTARAIVR